MARGELKKTLKELKDQKRPLFLAIDNVFKTVDFGELLLVELGSGNLPTSSCIAMTLQLWKFYYVSVASKRVIICSILF